MSDHALAHYRQLAALASVGVLVSLCEHCCRDDVHSALLCVQVTQSLYCIFVQ